MFLPDVIYHMLPFVHVVVGLIVVSKMNSLLGVASGVVLGITSLSIWRMRVDYRSDV